MKPFKSLAFCIKTARVGFAANLLILSVFRASAGQIVTLDDVFSTLDTNAIAYDRENLSSSMVSFAISMIDPKARLTNGDNNKTEEQTPSLLVTNKLEDGVCYMKLAGLYEDASIVSISIPELMNDPASGLILDIRSAGGHKFDAVDKIAGLFLNTGVALYSIADTKGNILESHHSIAEQKRKGNQPLVLLVDEKTRNASELLAACLKGKQDVLLMGRTTAGDASLRESLYVDDNTFIYITTKRFVPFSGKTYHEKGVESGIHVMRESDPRESIKDSGQEISVIEENYCAHVSRLKDDRLIARASDVIKGLQAFSRDKDAERKKKKDEFSGNSDS